MSKFDPSKVRVPKDLLEWDIEKELKAAQVNADYEQELAEWSYDMFEDEADHYGCHRGE